MKNCKNVFHQNSGDRESPDFSPEFQKYGENSGDSKFLKKKLFTPDFPGTFRVPQVHSGYPGTSPKGALGGGGG